MSIEAEEWGERAKKMQNRRFILKGSLEDILSNLTDNQRVSFERGKLYWSVYLSEYISYDAPDLYPKATRFVYNGFGCLPEPSGYRLLASKIELDAVPDPLRSEVVSVDKRVGTFDEIGLVFESAQQELKHAIFVRREQARHEANSERRAQIVSTLKADGWGGLDAECMADQIIEEITKGQGA